MSTELALAAWRDGERLLAGTAPELRVLADTIIEATVSELRRRLGGPFTVSELAGLYDRDGTGWCTDLAARIAPDRPQLWDPRLAADAAFSRYARAASDYAGGRVLPA